MLNYIIQVVLFQILFLAVYDLFLRKETFFQTNRIYLIAAPILSFLLPMIKISTFGKAVIASETIIYLPEILLSPQKVIEKAAWYTSITNFDLVFFMGILVFSVIFLVKLIEIIRLIKTNKAENRATFKLIFLPNKAKAFSFFRYIFLGKEIPASQQETIIAHEIVHGTQNHSADLLFFELLKIVMWFNPILYFYQQRITIVHEYIADDFATKNSPKEHYINNLLSEVFAVENISFINQFYKHSFLKKRIIMMSKEKSKQVRQLKYLVLIPVLVSMLFYTACSDSEITEQTEAKKEFSTIYMKIGENEMRESKGKKETYLDMYVGTQEPSWKEITYKDLSSEEQLEYQEIIAKRKNDDYSRIKMIDAKIYKGANGRNILAHIFNFSKMKVQTEKINSNETSVPFARAETLPVFPGCDEGDRDCFSKMIQKQFAENFNKELPNTLGLSVGRKKIYVGFTINKEGNITEIKARAPHEDIKNEVIKIMKSLPKLTPGENNGEKVAVKFSIPFVIEVQ